MRPYSNPKCKRGQTPVSSLAFGLLSKAKVDAKRPIFRLVRGNDLPVAETRKSSGERPNLCESGYRTLFRGKCPSLHTRRHTSGDQSRDVAGLESGVDVDHRYVRCTTVEHPQQRGQPAERRTVTDAGRHRDYRAGNPASDDRRAALLPCRPRRRSRSPASAPANGRATGAVRPRRHRPSDRSRTPIHASVSSPSSATGRSLVPAVTTATRPRRRDWARLGATTEKSWRSRCRWHPESSALRIPLSRHRPA